MRILRVAQKTYPEVTGGGAYHVHAMSRDQAAMGHDVTLLTVGDRGEEVRDGYTVVRRPATVTVLDNDISAGVGRYLRRHADAFDVVHAHSHLYLSTNLAALARRLGGPPLAITNHGLYSQTAPERLFDVYLRTAGRWTFDTADVVFCYTEPDRKRLHDLGVSAPVEVVPNGIDAGRFIPDGPVDDRLVGDPTVLFVGRLVEGKRPGDAVEALTRLRERFPDVGLTLCGEGPLQKTLEATAQEQDVTDAVRFLGHVDYDSMPAVYRGADALVLPSRAEGFPRTVLEAMASSVPVVVSDLDQVAPVVGSNGGETVAIGDIAGFADRLISVLEAPEAYAPRERIERSLDWTGTVERTTAALEKL
jgi:glycosyltransferase involved in cell wall biosynthesis